MGGWGAVVAVMRGHPWGVVSEKNCRESMTVRAAQWLDRGVVGPWRKAQPLACCGL